MNLVSYLMESRGLLNAAQRLPTIAARFGVTTARMERALHGYADVAERFGSAPTLAVTANLVERYPRAFAALAERGVELAIHGYVHTDYRRLDLAQQKEHLERGLAAFQRLGILVDGFRCPYVRWNEASVEAARSLGLQYGSNRTVAWGVVPLNDGLSPQALRAYQKGLRLYGSEDASALRALPSDLHGLLDLPASLPDDEALVDRLRASPERRAEMWRGILDEVYALGELFVVILHHERFALLRSALEATLEDAARRGPPVWIAPLREISAWWQRRAGYRLVIEPSDGGGYRAVVPDDADLTVLARGIETDTPLAAWHDAYRIAPGGSFTFRSEKLPCVGVASGAPPALVHFLEEEGFAVRAGDIADCAIQLDGAIALDDAGKRALLGRIESSAAPLVRLWRWPRAARCALSLTGDVDSMTLLDFARRPFEV